MAIVPNFLVKALTANRYNTLKNHHHEDTKDTKKKQQNRMGNNISAPVL